MADPTTVALRGHRFGVYAYNTSSGSGPIWVDRVQSFDPTETIRTQDYYELGRVSKIGVTQDPAEYRIVLTKNMNDCELDFLLAGKNPNPVGGQNYYAANMLGKDINMYLIGRNDADTIDKEIEVTGCRVSEIAFRFTIREAITETWTLMGTAGKWYTSGFPHNAWGTPNTTTPGGIHGKEARIWFSSGSAPASREFRIQQFNIRASYPVDVVKELGRRAIVGQVTDAPSISFDFDVLTADDQPLDKLYGSSGSGYDLGTFTSVFDTYIRVYDPDLTEGASVLKMFKMENCRLTGATPTSAQVRGLATERYSLTVTKETTSGSAGLLVANANIL